MDNRDQQDQQNRQQDEPAPARQPRLAWRQHLRRAVIALGVIGSATLFALAAYVAAVMPDTPSIAELQEVRVARPSTLYSADGKLLATFSLSQQEPIELAQMSPHLANALVATEDHRFYQHRGIDIGRTFSAILHTVGGDAQGGSTITQQLARNLFPEEIGRARTLDRKLKEIVTAIEIERAYSKQQILEMYLNTVPFLYNVVGIEMAARTYFDKSAAELDVLESATLIGMLKGTSYYNPVQNPERAQKRRNVVLGQLVKRGMLADAEFELLREKPLNVALNRQGEAPSSAPHFVAHLRKRLIEWADNNDYNLFTDGLIIHSTLDYRMQQAATMAVVRQAETLQHVADVEWGKKAARLWSGAPSAYARMRHDIEPFRYFWRARPDLELAFIRESPEYKKAMAAGRSDAEAIAGLRGDNEFLTRLRAGKTRLEAGFVAIDPSTSEVKAWVGSRDFARDQFDHVALAARQPGSTFKPIVYGAALERGLRPSRVYRDGPVEIRSADGNIWRPTDMSAATGMPMTMREGLIHSKNTITAQVMQDAGLPAIVNLARAVGVKQSVLDPVPSLALGTSPVTLLEMVSAYSTIAQAGQYREPVLIKHIADRHGKVLARFGPDQPARAMSEQTAVELIDMMRGVVSRGTGTAIKTRFGIVADIAGKTGTTQDNTDGWFILMHPNLVAGAWVGFNDARVTMRTDHWGQGGHNAILVVGDFFRDTLKDKLIDVKAKFPRPKRPPVLVQAPELIEQLDIDRDDLQPSPGYGVMVRRNADGKSSTVVVGPPGMENGASISAEELARIMAGMGRDPLTGIPTQPTSGGGSAGSSGAGGQPW